MPKNSYLHFAFQCVAWLLFFQLTRLIFVAWNYAEFRQLPINEVLILPYKALYLDTAMTCYFMGIPFLLFVMALFSEKKIFLTISRYFSAFLVILVSFLSLCELPIYDEWHTKLNYTAAAVLFTIPEEVVRTATWGELFLGIIGTMILSIIGIFLFKKIVPIDPQPKRNPLILNVLFTLLTPGLLLLGLRGGYQQIPIQVSDAYYSQHNVLNIACTNSTFNLLSSCLKNKQAGKPYEFMPKQEANAVFSALTQASQDSTTHILTTQKPNIVLVILESWSGDLVKSCGGYDSITPNMEKLIQQGVFFSNCYASGYLSDQGMAALFSGFPAQPKTSIIKQPNKYEHLPCINQELQENGYQTSFLFGGQLSYGNIKSYLYFNHFGRILEGKDFESSVPQCALGVADEYLYKRQLQELAKEKQPFFAAMFTLSSHSPYDMPMKEVLHWGEKEKPYINSVLYADACLGDFIKKAKQESWYNNTLFIFVSDHSHHSPKNWAAIQPEYRKIPFLLYGEVIKPEYRGKNYPFVVSQLDFSATLLGQLGITSSRFPYSKNIFNPSSPRYAFYSFDEGFCMIKPEGRLCWHVKDQHIDFEKVDKPEDKAKMVKEGQAFLQKVMEDYFRY